MKREDLPHCKDAPGMARGGQVLPSHPDVRAAWLSAGAGTHPLPRALPAPQPWAAGRTGRARPVAMGLGLSHIKQTWAACGV